MAVSEKIKSFMDQGSWIRKMFEEGIALRQLHGVDGVFDLSLGNPVAEPPRRFFEELRRIAEEEPAGIHRYMPNAGYVETRTAVASQLNVDTGIKFTADHIVMTCGAGGALNVVVKTLVDPGDEVLIFAPYFVEYFYYADNHGAICKVVPPDDDFLPDFDAMESAITDRTKIVMVNSPNNPTGVVYSTEILDKLARIIRKKEIELGTEIYMVSDEPYRKILFDGMEFPHIFDHHDRSIVATSHSKDLALPGERIGFIAANPMCNDVEQLMDGLTFCNRTLGFVNAPSLMQHIISHLQDTSVDVMQYQVKRDLLYDTLSSIGYSVVKPQGAFYMFPKAPISNELEFVNVLREYKVLVVPGRGFGLEGYFRIAYCVEDYTLEGSLEGFRLAFDRCKS